MKIFEERNFTNNPLFKSQQLATQSRDWRKRLPIFSIAERKDALHLLAFPPLESSLSLYLLSIMMKTISTIRRDGGEDW